MLCKALTMVAVMAPWFSCLAASPRAYLEPLSATQARGTISACCCSTPVPPESHLGGWMCYWHEQIAITFEFRYVPSTTTSRHTFAQSQSTTISILPLDANHLCRLDRSTWRSGVSKNSLLFVIMGRSATPLTQTTTCATAHVPFTDLRSLG